MIFAPPPTMSMSSAGIEFPGEAASKESLVYAGNLTIDINQEEYAFIFRGKQGLS